MGFTLWCHQTWLTGKSSLHGGFIIGKSLTHSPSSIAMFDYQRVSPQYLRYALMVDLRSSWDCILCLMNQSSERRHNGTYEDFVHLGKSTSIVRLWYTNAKLTRGHSECMIEPEIDCGLNKQLEDHEFERYIKTQKTYVKSVKPIMQNTDEHCNYWIWWSWPRQCGPFWTWRPDV